jgi:hypothetical protein
MKSTLALLLIFVAGSIRAQTSTETEAKIHALFEKHCSECHSEGDEEPTLTKGTDLVKLLANANYINREKPETSELFRRVILPADNKKRMPRSKGVKGEEDFREPLSQDEQSQLFLWITGKTETSAAVSAVTTPSTSTAAIPPTVSLPPRELAQKVTDLFKARCAECHDQATSGRNKGNFGFVLDLARLRGDKRFVNLTAPQTSSIYVRLTEADPETRMPQLTKAEKEKGLTNPEALTGGETALVLEWLIAGAPDLGATPPPPPPPVSDASKPATSVPAAQPSIAQRTIFKESDAMAELYKDLLAIQSEHDRKQVRYISLLPQHNNTSEISDAQLEVIRSGVRKLLNSLSNNPKICLPEEVGPGKAFFRFKLDDLAWDAPLWERIISFYPYALQDSNLGNAAGTDVPVLRADWLATNGARPPLYDDILKLPRTQQELEQSLGVNVTDNLQRNKALRAGFSSSGISRFNRMIERHDLGSRRGYYWLSYDFSGDEGARNLLQNPLGPLSAHLAGGTTRVFEHDGGEIIFSLPNGFQGYYLSNSKGTKLDVAPTSIVGDQGGVTGRPDVVNGLSCMICHSAGMKEQPGNPKSVTDLVRGTAKSGFKAAEEEVILALYRDQKDIDNMIDADRQSFKKALAAAGVKPSAEEPISTLSKPFEEKLTLARAAAELGFSAADLEKEIRDRDGFGILRIALGQGALSRGAFGEQFADVAERLRVGKIRQATAISQGTVDVLRQQQEKKQPKPLLFEIKTDRQVYKGGDPVQIAVFAETAGHLRMFYKDAKGKVYTLFPTDKQFKDAAALGVRINDDIPGGQTVLVSGERSITGVTIHIQKKNEPNEQGVKDAVFGHEQLGAVVTDIPIEDDAALRAEIEKSGNIAKAVSLMAEAVTKSAIGRINAAGASGGEVPKPRIGLQLLNLETKPD